MSFNPRRILAVGMLCASMFSPHQAVAAQQTEDPAACAAVYYWLDSRSGNGLGSWEFEEFVRVALRRVNGEFKSIAADARGNAHRLGQAVESGQIPIHAVLARAQECSRQFSVALPAGYVKLAAASGQKQDYAALERHCTGLLNDYERSFPDPAGFAATMHALPGPEGDFHAEQVLGPLSWYRSEAEKAGCPGNLVSLMRRGNEKLSNLSKTARSLGSSQQALRQEIEELEFLKSMNR